MDKQPKNLWQCELKGESDVFSVGSLYTLSCADASGQALLGNEAFEQKPHIMFEHEHMAYALVILRQTVNTAHKAEFVVTSYVPDVYKNVNFKVTDGFTSFYAEDLSWQVKSVLPPNKPAQPYGPLGPFAIGWPGWLWPSVAILVVACVSALFYWFYKKHKWRVWMNKIKLPSTNLSPSDQFYKDLRLALSQQAQLDAKQQTSEFTSALSQVLRHFLVRRYKIPAVYQNVPQMLKSLKKQVPRDKLKSLARIFVQLQKAQQPDTQTQQQLAHMLRQWVRDVDSDTK